jgi:protein-tyrosine phosphatase
MMVLMMMIGEVKKKFFHMEDLWHGRAELQEILPRVFLGSFFSVRKAKQLEEARITHVLNLTHELPFPSAPAKLSCHRIAFSDNATGVVLPLTACLEHIDRVFEESNDNRIAVHCAAGSSRSGAILVALVMAKRCLSVDDALKFVQQIRPTVMPNPGFIEQLREFEKQQQRRQEEECSKPE